MNRRNFIQLGALAGSAVVSLPVVGQATIQQPVRVQTERLWYQRPLRILQTVLREPDARDYDANAVVQYMLKSGCNTLVVNAGGIVDFFQNPLPANNINPFVGKGDLLREITLACKASNIRVIGRVDFRGVEEKIYRQFPDWFSRDQAGDPMQLNYTRPALYQSCYTGYHRTEHAEEFIRYLLTNYSLDGIWHNSIGVGGICYCERCRESYRKTTGQPIPDESASDDMVDQYMHWKTAVAAQHMQRMKNTVKSFGNDKVYTAEVFSMFEAGGRINSGIDLYHARDHFDFLVSVAFLTENSEHIEYEDLHYASTIIRFLKSMAPDKEAIILYGGNGTAHRYIMDPPVDLHVWLWEALSAGGRFWNCNFTGSHPAATHDRRNAFNSAEIYAFVRDHEDAFTAHAPVATVGIYYSRPTRQFFRKRIDGDSFEAGIKGMESVLMENHIPYDFIADDQLDRARLRKYDLVILPNVKCMSAAEIELFSDYVNQGGSLMATYETSLYNTDGSPRDNFGLADVFGCNYAGEKINTRKDCYQYIRNPSHPLVEKESKETELLINAGFTLLCNTDNEDEIICSYSPLVHNQPPEKAWSPEWSKTNPTVLEHRHGKGKVIYFSNQPDQVTYEMGHPDMRNLLKNSILLLAGTLPIEARVPESVHVGLTRSNDSGNHYILSLVNITSGPVRPIRSIQPVFNLRVALNLDGKSLKAHEVLRSQGESKVSFSNGQVLINLDRLEDFFALHLEMSR
jgi:hypothetical protein